MTAETVTRALTLWGMADASAVLLAERENRVYRVTGPGERMTALRLHRRDFRSDGELLSELQWMEILAEGGLAVPQPIPSTEGNLHETVDGYQVDLLSWLDGAPLTAPIGVETFRALGRAMAKMHELSDAWTPPPGFSRWSWDGDGLLGEAPVWGRFWENPALTAGQAALLGEARQKARALLTAIGPGLDAGLIHADLVRENVLHGGGQVRFIDFDDSGFGFRLFDLATTLLANRGEAEYPALETALIDGYKSVRDLDVTHLRLFLMLRALTYVGWIVPRLDEPGGEARCRRFIGRAVGLAEDFINEGE